MSYYEDDGPIVVTPPQQIEIETENGTTLVSGSHGTAAPVVGNAPKTSREYTYTRADIKQFAREEVNESIDEVVEANPALAGTEADLTGLKVGDTKYKVPTGTNVEANPTLEGTESDLEGLKVGATKYKVPPRVIPNPTLEGTEANLEGLQVGNTKYKVGGGGSSEYKHCYIVSLKYSSYYGRARLLYFTNGELSGDSNSDRAKSLAADLYNRGFVSSNKQYTLVTNWFYDGGDANVIDRLVGCFCTAANGNLDASIERSTFTTDGASITITKSMLSTQLTNATIEVVF